VAQSRKYGENDLVRELMTTDVDRVAPSSKITDAAKQMRDLNIGSLPVVDRQEVVGIITDRDIAVRATADGVNPDEVLVKEVMTANPVTISPDQKVSEAADLMAQHQIRRLPVVENGKLVGILSLGDVATEPDAADEAGSALSDISRPSDFDASIQQSRDQQSTGL
jgi:CBS domain-containing protein